MCQLSLRLKWTEVVIRTVSTLTPTLLLNVAPRPFTVKDVLHTAPNVESYTMDYYSVPR